MVIPMQRCHPHKVLVLQQHVQQSERTEKVSVATFSLSLDAPSKEAPGHNLQSNRQSDVSETTRSLQQAAVLAPATPDGPQSPPKDFTQSSESDVETSPDEKSIQQPPMLDARLTAMDYVCNGLCLFGSCRSFSCNFLHKPLVVMLLWLWGVGIAGW